MINVDLINIDFVIPCGHALDVAIYVRSEQAARILGVSTATLYAYVSRGRVERIVAADGRSSLFDKDALEALASSKRSNQGSERPSIDAQIASAITLLAEESVSVRGHRLPELVAAYWFEDIAELLWTGELPADSPTQWPADRVSDAQAKIAAGLDVGPIAKLSVLAHLLHAQFPADDVPMAARRLLRVAPAALGSRARSGPLAERLAAAWIRNPSPQLVTAMDTALGLLADHELATSTLAVRVAASVRPSPYEGFVAGLATVAGRLHGAAAQHAARFVKQCADEGVAPSLAELQAQGRPIPGFGHAVYRGDDPRYAPLMAALAPLDAAGEHLSIVHELVTTVAQSRALYPNIDLALGTMLWVTGIDPEVPIFAVARIAGWAAHFDEELAARPVRYRGMARVPAGS